jgi:hypothetical protein
VPENGKQDSVLRYGNIAAVLQMLGGQLRQMVMNGEMDEVLLAAIEWNVDRHHRRAIEILRELLARDDEFLRHGQQLTRAGRALQDAEAGAYRRLQRILQLISPDVDLERVPSVVTSIVAPD